VARSTKSWADKLAAITPHQVKRMPRDLAGMKKGEIVLVPSVRLIDDFIRALPRGARISVKDMRNTLARRHGAEVTCPVYTGYHLRTVAEAACEARAAGARVNEITPVWRVLDESAPTMSKLSRANAAFITRQRIRERGSDETRDARDVGTDR
jgi:hypothetical protein